MTREQLLELLTTAASVGFAADRAKTRGDLRREVEISMRKQLDEMSVVPLDRYPTIGEVVDHLVLTDVNEDYWYLNVARFNAGDEIKISSELADELLKLKSQRA
jgi:hypothetical protein